VIILHYYIFYPSRNRRATNMTMYDCVHRVLILLCVLTKPCDTTATRLLSQNIIIIIYFIDRYGCMTLYYIIIIIIMVQIRRVLRTVSCT